MRSESPHPILLYGDSLLLATVESRLRAGAGLRVIHIDPSHPTAAEQLAALQDGVLVYDRHSTDPEVVSAFLAAHLQTPTVGLDAGGDRALVLGSREYPSSVVAGLARVLALLCESVVDR